MIPKILHYIWLGEKTALAKKCIASYSKYLKDYKIIEWNETNIDITNYDPVLKENYEYYYNKKRYAFCSDIARLYILKEFGGFYVDADLEFIKSIPESVREMPCLCRCNPTQEIGNGYIWGCEKEDPFVITCIRWFSEHLSKFKSSHGSVWIFNNIIQRFFKLFGYDLSNKETQDIIGYRIYSADYFCTFNFGNKKIEKTKNSIAIHHFASSWVLRS